VHHSGSLLTPGNAGTPAIGVALLTGFTDHISVMIIKIHHRFFVKHDFEFMLPPFQKECSDETILKWVFRQFNRVDDNELVSILGLPVPSLSMGDYVALDDRLYKVDFVGFTEVSREEIFL